MTTKQAIGLRAYAAHVVSFVFVSFCSPFILPRFTAAQTNAVKVVVSATRTEQELSKVASSISVIDTEDIERHQYSSAVEALASESSLDVVSTGGRGASTSVSIRGANPEHTLVILDGIELNNPILPSRSFNFADLALSDIDRIEILRGPQSTLYGSDAMGGVINIISKQGEGPLSVKASAEGGSFGSFTEQASVSEGQDSYNYGLSVLRQDSDGFSAADSRLGNREKDGYSNTSYAARIGLAPTEETQFQSILRAINSTAELDNFGGAFGDDPNREQDNEQYFWGTSLVSNLLEDKLKTTIAYSLSDQSFTDNNDPDNLNQDILRSRYQGRLNMIHGQADYAVMEGFTLTLGAESQEESGESRYKSDGFFGPFESNFEERSATTNAYYLQASNEFQDQLFLTTGLRVDDHSKFGSETTWRVAPAWLITPETRIFTTIGSGFKAPSLFQLYSSFGREDLEAETSFAVDAGVEQQIVPETLKIRITYFRQEFDELINFDPNTFIFSNIDSATNEGIETSLEALLCDWLALDIGYTYLDATNDETGAVLLRRARNKLSADLRINPSEIWGFGVQSDYRSSRFDNDFSAFPATTENLAGYTTVNLYGNYRVSEQVELYARVDNVFDTNYVEVLGYGTAGVAGYGGVRVSF